MEVIRILIRGVHCRNFPLIKQDLTEKMKLLSICVLVNETILTLIGMKRVQLEITEMHRVHVILSDYSFMDQA